MNGRAVFNQLSKVIWLLLWFCFTSLCDWLTKLALLSQPMRNKIKPNCDWLARVFPRLALRVLIGSEITLVLVLRLSNEHHSKDIDRLASKYGAGIFLEEVKTQVPGAWGQ